MESRLKKSLSAGGREARSSQDASRVPPQEKFISSNERRKMFTDEWNQSALPNAPEIPGWHTCWLSTTNTYDTIEKRFRQGYVPVKMDEHPGYESYRVKAGEYAGFIACNEMILCKIPMELYQEIMLMMHHEAPMEEADKVRVQLEQLQGTRDSSGKSLGRVEGEGFGNFDQSVPTPIFQG